MIKTDVVEPMDYGNMVSESFAYAKEGVWGKWSKWILLIISCIIFPLILGYMMRIFKGTKPAPELEQWGGMFIDGIKLFVVELIYAIPIIIIELLLLGSTYLMYISNPAAIMAALGSIFAGVVVLLIVIIIIELFLATACVRFARTNTLGDAFSFGVIMAHIGKIGWLTYFIALIIMTIIMGVISIILMLIPVVGIVLLFIVLPILVLFEARYLCLLYDRAGTAA
jgi:hypothetical protein